MHNRIAEERIVEHRHRIQQGIFVTSHSIGGGTLILLHCSRLRVWRWFDLVQSLNICHIQRSTFGWLWFSVLAC